mgnify:CR=1 FL=1
MSVTIWFEESLADVNLPLDRIVNFCDYLREHGIQTSVQDASLLVEVLGFCNGGLTSRRVEQLWRPIICQSVREWRLWPKLFTAFWFPQTLKGSVRVTGTTRRSTTLWQVIEKSKSMGESASGGLPQVGDNPASSDQKNSSGTKQKATGGASLADPAAEDTKTNWMPADLAILERLARTLKSQLLNVPTRRWNISDRGRFLNLRKTTQSMMRLGGDGVIPAWQKRRKETPRIVIAVDVSRSMETYAEFYLRLARAFSRWLPIRVFVFHVQFAEVTDLLKTDNPKMHAKINNVVAGFQGGTKIASNLKRICFDSDGVSLNRRTRLWIFSDGYDTDEPTALRDVLRRVRSKGATIDWFYPNRSVAGMSHCIQLIKPLVNDWYSAANLKEFQLSVTSLK